MEKSIKEKRDEIHSLSFDICYGIDIPLNGKNDHPNIFDKFWIIVDLGYWQDKALTGRCSLAVSLSLNLGKWEKEIDKDIRIAKKIIQRYKTV